jgi:hypothetical protein
MILVGYIHIWPGPHVVPDVDALVRDDVTAAADDAAVADSQHRIRPELMAGHEPCRHGDLSGDQGVPADRDPFLAEDRSLRERHERTGAELPERLPGRRVRGHHPGSLALPPSPVHGAPQQLLPRVTDSPR